MKRIKKAVQFAKRHKLRKRTLRVLRRIQRPGRLDTAQTLSGVGNQTGIVPDPIAKIIDSL